MSSAANRLRLITISFRLRARVPDDLGPLQRLGLDVRGEFLRRAAHGLRTLAREPLDDLAHMQDRDDLAVEPYDDGSGRARGHHHPCQVFASNPGRAASST